VLWHLREAMKFQLHRLPVIFPLHFIVILSVAAKDLREAILGNHDRTAPLPCV